MNGWAQYSTYGLEDHTEQDSFTYSRPSGANVTWEYTTIS